MKSIKGITFLGIAVVVALGTIVGIYGTHSPELETKKTAITFIEMTTKNGLPLFTKESLQNEMEYNFKETTWYPLINYYVISDEDRTIKVILNKEKSNIPIEKAQSISGAIAGLTYKEGRTNYYIYKVVDSNNKLIYTFDIIKRNSKEMGEALKQVFEQADGIILNIKRRDEDWSSIYVTVSDSWYNAQEFEKKRFVEGYGNLIADIVLKYMYIIGKDNVFIYFIDEFGTEVATPKLFGGYKIKG